MSSGVVLELERLVLEPRLGGQLGELRVGGEHVCWTLEELWRDNRRKVSCIPAGTYALRPHWRRIADELALALEAVPGRSGVLIHVGNTISNIEGCIAVGLRKEESKGLARVLESRAAMRRVSLLKPARIVIRWSTGTPPPAAD